MDWHVPTLGEVFALVARTPPSLIFLDTKLPPGDHGVARRMAEQYMEQLRLHPALRACAMIACPDAELLGVMKEEVKRAPDFAGFDGFALDHEELSSFFVGHSTEEATPVRGAGSNRYLSIGAPYMPLAVGGFADVVTLVRRTLAETRDPASPHHGKPLCVWTIDEEAEMRALAELGPEYILTNRPALLHRVLDAFHGPRGVDPRRPRVVCHRGGPDGSGAPENTLPMIERGLIAGDAIEFDICSARDGAIIHHDNDPNALGAVVRRRGGEVGEFRPAFAEGASEDRRMDQMTVAEIQAVYRYVRDEKGFVADLETAAESVADLATNRR